MAAVGVTLAAAAGAGAALAPLGGEPLRVVHLARYWFEVLFLAVSAGLLVRALRRTTGELESTSPALRFAAVAFAASLTAALAGVAFGWGSHFGRLLTVLWRPLPFMDQARPEYLLRAGLVPLGGLLWFLLVQRSVPAAAQRTLLRVWLAVTAGTIVCGAWVWMRGADASARMQAGFDDANSYGSYLVLCVFVAVALLLKAERSRERVAAVGGLSLALGGLLLSGSRAAVLVALVGGVAVAGALGRRWGFVAIALASVALVVVVLRVVVPPAPDEPPLIRMLRQVTQPRLLAESLGTHRLTVWKAAGRAFVEEPLFGIGPGALYRTVGRYYAVSDTGWMPLHENAHNYFLQLLAESGVFTVVALVWLVASIVAQAWRGSPATRVLAVGAVAYLITALTGHPLILVRQAALFWGLVGLAALTGSSDEVPEPTRGSGVRRLLAASPIVIVVALVVFFVIPGHAGHCGAWREDGRRVVWRFEEGFHSPEEVAAAERWHEGFYPLGPPPVESRRWMERAGRISVCNRTAQPLVAEISFNVASFAEPRHVGVYVRGRRLAEIAATPEPHPVTVAWRAAAGEQSALVLVPSPGARRIDDVLTNGDQRRVTIRMDDPVISVRAIR